MIPQHILDAIDDLSTHYEACEIEPGVAPEEQEYYKSYLALRAWLDSQPQPKADNA